MSKQPDLVSITIDNHPFWVDRGLTILQAAERNKVYIPTLCAHKDLTPFGGCRLCIVEVEGMRGFPTSCTTPVTDGMVVRTQTTQVQAVRTEILQLILSEHPVACLICNESEECKKYNSTIRKVGVTTGCRYCPNDEDCELHDVADKIGIKEIGYPILYRNLPVEKEDPFFDRDYNLCILCGRCIRMCQEIRTAGTLAFKQRGHKTIIGPAYNRTHIEAGCEFCGACVSVCPTGALSEKTRKWEGKPDREEHTTCAFCGIGCQVRLEIKGNEIIGALPADDLLVNNGQLCVKGRFCVSETVNDHRRLKRPYKMVDGTMVDIPFEEAVEIAAAKLSECSPSDFAMLISPNCTCEDLFVAQKFVRTAIGSNNIDTSSRIFYGSSFNSYLKLMKRAVPLSTLKESSCILCVGLDTRFAQSVAGVELRLATRRGAKVISINSAPHNLTLIAEKWLRPYPDQMLDTLNLLISQIESPPDSKAGSEDIAAIAALLKKADHPVILIGAGLLGYPDSAKIFDAIERLARGVQAGIMPLPPQNNLLGSLFMGSYPELLPGAISYADKKTQDQIRKIWGRDLPVSEIQRDANSIKSGVKILYVIGEVPTEERPPSEYLIYQNIFHAPPSYRADLAFPGTAFTETDGAFINGEMRIQSVRKAVNPPGLARPDWEILSLIARKMGKPGFDYINIESIHSEIDNFVSGFSESEITKRNPLSLSNEIKLSIPSNASAGEPSKQYPLTLNINTLEHSYKGYPLANWVAGLRRILDKGTLTLNPADALKAGLSEGDKAEVSSANRKWAWPIQIAEAQYPGTASIALPLSEAAGFSSYNVNIRKSDV